MDWPFVFSLLLLLLFLFELVDHLRDNDTNYRPKKYLYRLHTNMMAVDANFFLFIFYFVTNNKLPLLLSHNQKFKLFAIDLLPELARK